MLRCRSERGGIFFIGWIMEMTRKELKKIIAVMDYDGICTEIEKRGYRRAKEGRAWEFKPLSLLIGSTYREEVVKRRRGKECRLALYKGYEEATYLFVRVYGGKQRSAEEAICESMLFTDAPINEEYERDIRSIVRCEACGRKYAKKELFDDKGKIVCNECYQTNRQFLQELGDIIKKIRGKED